MQNVTHDVEPCYDPLLVENARRSGYAYNIDNKDAQMNQVIAQLVVDRALHTGIDIGGTKIGILDSRGETYHRYTTADYAKVEDVLDDYFAKLGKRPAKVVLAMAGPRDDETGAIEITNGNLPSFSPLEAEKRYPGTVFETVNDMVGTAAGVLAEEGIELRELRPGTPTRTGSKLVVALSTGFNASVAVWNKHLDQYVIVPTESGHIGMQPENDAEIAYLKYLQTKHPHVSAEIALSGKLGMNYLVDHVLAEHYDTELIAAINRAREAGRPVGSVLLEFAEAGEGTSRDVARLVLDHLGNMLGSIMCDMAIAFVATGGVYLTGSVALALGEYLAAETNMLHRFARNGSVHDTWLEKVPIYLVTDPHVAAKGALSLAKQ